MAQPKYAPIELHPGIVLKGQLSMASDVVLTGKFEGDLKTLGCLTVPAGGAATGTIEAGALVLEPGNEVEAKIKVGASGGQRPMSLMKKAGVSKWPSRLKKLTEFALGRR
jgi:hypothetical protein